MTPAEIVQRFQTLTARCLDSLRANFDGIERLSAGSRTVLVPRDGSIPVSCGTSDEQVKFVLHGRGCRFELVTGEVLDIDWTDQGVAVFDAWRMLMFARSIGDDQIQLEALRSAAAASPHLWHLEGEWFTWADRSYAVDWQPGLHAEAGGARLSGLVPSDPPDPPDPDRGRCT